jgi:hypothetical protein
MEKVSVRIEGVPQGMMQHRFPMEDNPETKVGKRKKVYLDKEECEKSLYRDESGKIYQPSEHILGALINAGKNFTFEKKRTYKDVVKSSVFINPAIIYHENETWVVDRRPVTIQRARIVRARPLFPKWALSFEIEYDNELISKAKMKELLDYAGQRVGIGDYRPLFGRFIVTKFEEI